MTKKMDRTGTRLSKNQKTLPSKAWIRSPNGQGRVKIGARIPVEELEALEAMAEGFEISLSEAVRQAVREKLTKEKLLVKLIRTEKTQTE